MSTAAMDKLPLLSLQFLQKTGKDTLLPDPTRPVRLLCLCPGCVPRLEGPPSPQLELAKGEWQGTMGEEAENVRAEVRSCGFL